MAMYEAVPERDKAIVLSTSSLELSRVVGQSSNNDEVDAVHDEDLTVKRR